MLLVLVGIGGIKELILLVVILNGVIIYVLGNKFLKFFWIINFIVWGLVFGISGYILGVVLVKELGFVEELMVSIVLVLVGVVVVVVVFVFVVIFF